MVAWRDRADWATPLRGGSGALRPRRARALELLVLGGVIVLTGLVAVRLYTHYLAASRAQWAALHHDRNSHLLESMLVALDLRYFEPLAFIGDLHRMKAHPPLFRILAAPVLALGGFDYRLAALVSLAGWVGMVLLVFLVTRWLAPSHGDWAALLAALFALRSPAHRAYATDIMLESLGACLVLLVLHLYLRVRDRAGSARGFTPLGCGLTALFFLKYNYWYLTALVLLLWEGVTRHREIRTRLHNAWIRGGLRANVARELRHPATWLLSGLVAFAGLLMLAGRQEFFWAGRRVTKSAPLDLVYAFFVILCMRAGFLFWRRRLEIRGRVGEGVWQLILSHGLPVIAWLLWPQKLLTILWYLSPMNSASVQRSTFWTWETLWYYPRAIVTEYHDSTWTAVAALALLLLAYLRAFRLPSHARLVLFFLAVAAISTTLHPNHQSRYVHPWLALLWIAGAIGLASVVGDATRQNRGGVALRFGLIGLFILAVAANPVSFAFARPSVTRGRPDLPTALDLSDYYLPRIGCHRYVSIFATVPLDFFAHWTYLQQYPGQRDHVALVMKKLTDPYGVNQSRFAEWLVRSPTEAIVFIDVPPGSVFYWPGDERYQQYRTLLQSQGLFREVEGRGFPQYGATVRILVRTDRARPPRLCTPDRGPDT